MTSSAGQSKSAATSYKQATPQPELPKPNTIQLELEPDIRQNHGPTICRNYMKAAHVSRVAIAHITTQLALKHIS